MNDGLNDGLKEWKLVQGMLGLVAATALGFYVTSGNFQAREWFPFLPASPAPDTLIFHAARLRQALLEKRYSEALREAEWVLKRDKDNPEAIRGRAACLLRVGRFAEAEKVFRRLIVKDKKDVAARLSLATALRGQGSDEKARGILLRLLKDPYADTLQRDAARASLDAMDFNEPLFADQPLLVPKKPAASPPPEPRPTLSPLGAPLSTLLGGHSPRSASPTPQPWALQRPRPVSTPTPEPPVAAVLLAPPPSPEPTENTENIDELEPIVPLKIPPPARPKAPKASKASKVPGNPP